MYDFKVINRSSRLGVAIYQQIRAHMLLKPPLLAYKSDNPLTCVEYVGDQPNLNELCRIAGIAVLTHVDGRRTLSGRESLVQLVLERMRTGPIDVDAMQRAFDADWRNTIGIEAHQEMEQARAEVFALPELASMIAHSAAHGGLRLSGVLPAPAP